MGEAIPLKYFQTMNEGIKLYLDPECTIEEKIDETNLINKTYVVTFPNVIRGKKKSTIRYIKNCGTDQLMYVLYPATQKEGKTTMILNNEGGETEYVNGDLSYKGVHRVEIFLEVEKESENPEIKLGLASRRIVQ
ncbi:MAG: hypothetical protein ACRC1P_10925 [Cellulosilyticaceae bacterium]